MTGSLLPVVVWRAIDANGLAMSGAKLFSYLTGTTTPTNMYTSSTLGTPTANPLVSDSGGLFAPTFLDPAVTYRLQLKTSGGSLTLDIDPYVPQPGVVSFNTRTGAVTLTSGDVTTALTYTPVNKAGDTATALNVTPATTPGTSAAGYLGMPLVTKDAAYSFVRADCGKLYRHTDGSARAWTIQPNASEALPIGSIIGFRNAGSGVVTLTRGAAVTLAIAGSATSKDVAVAQYGFGTIVKEDTDTWVATGTGLS